MNAYCEIDDVRELSASEFSQVAGGSDMAVAAGLFAVGATLTGTLALVPGPHVPVAAAISALFAVSSAGCGLLASFED